MKLTLLISKPTALNFTGILSCNWRPQCTAKWTLYLLLNCNIYPRRYLFEIRNIQIDNYSIITKLHSRVSHLGRCALKVHFWALHYSFFKNEASFVVDLSLCNPKAGKCQLYNPSCWWLQGNELLQQTITTDSHRDSFEPKWLHSLRSQCLCYPLIVKNLPSHNH